MHRALKTAGVCLLLVCLVTSSADAETVQTQTEKLQAGLFKYFEKYDTMGGNVAIFQNGEITFTYAYGTETTAGHPVTDQTRFQVGSISKMVANIGLMQLLEKNDIALDTEIGEIFGFPIRHPNYPDTPVTLRQLMTHTASLRDSGYYTRATAGHPISLDKLFSGDRLPAMFFEDKKPGTFRSYSNFGGGLIGSLIEKLSGQTVDDYMTEHVFEPLGIIASFQASRMPDDVPLANIYEMPEKRVTKVLRDDPSRFTEPDFLHHYFITAGKLIISAADTAKVLMVLCDGGESDGIRILSESAAAEIITLQNEIGSVMVNSGNGLFLNIIEDDQVQGRTMYGHGGKAYGMLCAAYFDPTDRTGVVMLTNGCRVSSVHNGVGMLGRQILQTCYQIWIDPVHHKEDPYLVE